MPQTWEDPGAEHRELKVMGDNDPLDVVEVSGQRHEQGKITRVRVLGALAMIDSGELDWKVIVVDASKTGVTSLAHLEKGVVTGILEWFRWYKMPDGPDGSFKLNKFGNDDKPKNEAETLEVIAETHEAWKKLRNGATPNHGLWIG